MTFRAARRAPLPSRADEISAAFASALGGVAEPLPGALAGIEHEYEVARDGARIDFRALIHTLRLDGARLDPGDPNAYRCAWGGVVTADGREAEIATPAVRRRAGYASDLEAIAALGRRALEERLPAGVTLRGYSTHVNVSMPRRWNDAVALLYVQTFAPALMLMMDRPNSPGMLVRPRPGRLELCGEFVDGARLRAVVAFAVASVRACADAVIRGAPAPEPLRVVIEPGVERFGWYVDRTAFGPDLYARGRRARLRTVAGRAVRAQERLVDALAHAERFLDDDDRAAVAAIVHGDEPLPSSEAASEVAMRPAPQLVALRACARPAFAVAPVAATWDHAVFEISGARRAYAYVPRDALPGFATSLERGALDAVIESYLAQRARRRTLGETNGAPALCDVAPSPKALCAPERDPIAAASAPAVAAVIAGVAQSIATGMPVLSPKVRTRPGKNVPVDPPSRGFPVWGWLAIGGLILAIFGFAVCGGGGGASVPGVITSTGSSAPAETSEPPVISPITAEFVQADFATTYTIEASARQGGALTFRWALTPPAGDPTCTNFAPVNPPGVSPNRAVWHHNGDADGCSHSSQQTGARGHLGTVRVFVTNARWSCEATYLGTISGPGPKPTCRPRA
jgi:hypothetical protein